MFPKSLSHDSLAYEHIQQSVSTLSLSDGYVQIGVDEKCFSPSLEKQTPEQVCKSENDMTRENSFHETKENTSTDQLNMDDEAVLSQVFAVDQFKQGIENTASFFTWGLETITEQLALLQKDFLGHDSSQDKDRRF